MARLACRLIVRDRQGRPLAGLRIAVEHASEATPDLAAVTGPDGRARLGLPPGGVGLALFLPDGTRRVAEIVVGDDPDRTYEVNLDV